MKFVCAACAAAALWLVAPGAALADECSIDSVSSTNPGNALFDPGGYEFDVQDSTTSGEYGLRNFGGFDDGGANGPAGNPPGPRVVNDSWDEWPGLYVGSATDDAPLSTSYNSPDDNSCTREDAGRELVFPMLTVNGLQVQRKLYVAPAGLQGGRVLVLVTNPSGAPVTTSVQLGGIDSNDGDLGSDSATAIRSSSSGDTQFTPADFSAVTSDHLLSAGTVNSDPALAHLVDAPGGVDRVDAINVLNPPDLDDVMFRWQSVNILPGQTAAFLFYEIQQKVADGNAAAEDAAAAQVASQVEFLSQEGSAEASKSAKTFVTSPVYAGMSSREIGSLRNWPTNLHCFGRSPTIVGDDPTNDALVGTAGPDVILSFGGNDKINGLGGKDRICAAAGKDILRGGGGKDMLDGGTGKDRLAGGKGKDSCLGGKGKDKAAGCEKLKKIP